LRKSLDKVDWHVRHLFNASNGFAGWQTIENITQNEHMVHPTTGRQKRVRNLKELAQLTFRKY
jgi:hypothetical protein